MNTLKKILVVDDDSGIREVIHLILENEGYQVNELADGHDLDQAVHNFLPDVILLDVMLGDMDGRDLCRDLKNESATKNIPVIMVSASHAREVLQDNGCQANDYLAKPFDIADLIDKVAHYAAA